MKDQDDGRLREELERKEQQILRQAEGPADTDRGEQDEQPTKDKSAMDFAPGSDGGSAGDGGEG